MINNISTDVFYHINCFIEKRFGLYFPEKRSNDLVRGISNAAKQKQMNLEAYINLLLSNQLSEEDIKNLVTCLTIGETYFFRDKKLFGILRKSILKDMIQERKYTSKRLKIWSAGCSSGEEAYSIAILITELLPDYKDWNIQIIATDINHLFLNKAKKGIYSEWSFRGVDLKIKSKYFDKIEERYYKIKEDIRNLVEFHELNLAQTSYKIKNQHINEIDIIFCRNVLMYFSTEQVKEIIHRFYNSMEDNGWFIVAPTESLFLSNTSFIPVNKKDMFLYQKDRKNKTKINLWDTEIIEKKLFLENEIIKKNFLKVKEEACVQNNIVQDNKEDVQAFERLSRSFANEGNLEEAIKWCKKAISIDKINPYYYYFLASIQQEEGDIVQAIAALKKAIYLDADFIMAYFDLGNLNLKREKYKEAAKNFETAYELLNYFREEDTVPHSEEMTVGALKQIIKNMDYKGGAYGEK